MVVYLVNGTEILSRRIVRSRTELEIIRESNPHPDIQWVTGDQLKVKVRKQNGERSKK